MLLTACVCIVLSMTPWFSAAAILPQLRDLWHIPLSHQAFVTVAVQVGFVVGAIAIAGANLADILPAPRLIAMSSLAVALSNLILLVVSDERGAIAARFATGFFLAGVYPAMLRLIATWFLRRRGIALGSVIGALTLGSATPHLLNAFGSIAWQGVILLTSVATAVSGALSYGLLREGPFAARQPKVDFERLSDVVRNRAVVLAIGGYLGHMWELYAMWAWILYFIRDMLHSAAQSGGAASALAFGIIAAGAPACVVAGALSDRLGRTATTIGLMSASGACAVLIGATYRGPTWLFAIVAFVWGATVVADSAQFSAIVADVADGSYVGTALSIQLAVGFGLTAVTLWLMPLAANWLGSWQWAFLILAPGPVLGILSMMALRRLPESRLIAHGLR